jgi:hypothetical protein
MQKRKLGRSGLEVPALGFGCSLLVRVDAGNPGIPRRSSGGLYARTLHVAPRADKDKHVTHAPSMRRGASITPSRPSGEPF